MPYTVSAGIGFVAVSGVAMLAGLVMVSTMRRLLREGRDCPESEATALETRKQSEAADPFHRHAHRPLPAATSGAWRAHCQILQHPASGFMSFFEVFNP